MMALLVGETAQAVVRALLFAGIMGVVGGTLFANNEAEPEIFSLAEGKASPIPGWDADVARQRKALEKDREKRAKRG